MIVGETVLLWIFWYLSELLKILRSLNFDPKLTRLQCIFVNRMTTKMGWRSFWLSSYFTSEPDLANNLLQTIFAVMISSWIIIHLYTPKILSKGISQQVMINTFETHQWSSQRVSACLGVKNQELQVLFGTTGAERELQMMTLGK